MIYENPLQAVNGEPVADVPIKYRRSAQSKIPSVLADIYQEETNIAIWQRELSVTLKASVNNFLASNRTFQIAMVVTPQSVFSSIAEFFGAADHSELSENIAELVDMYCCLFELERAGLRLAVLDRAMCPKFHVDRVPCRLVTTYYGPATEWLPHEAIDRAKLSAGSYGRSDNQSDPFQSHNDIYRLTDGDVALLKGELWEKNENAGLVHRSPALQARERRLLLTLDFSN